MKQIALATLIVIGFFAQEGHACVSFELPSLTWPDDAPEPTKIVTDQ